MTVRRYKNLVIEIRKAKPKTILEIGTWNGGNALKMIREAQKWNREITYYGFDIFEDIFDSSYDDIYDERERLEKIFNVVDNFLKNNNLLQLGKIREDIFPRLLYNYNHFWNDFRKEISLKFYKDMEKLNNGI